MRVLEEKWVNSIIPGDTSAKRWVRLSCDSSERDDRPVEDTADGSSCLESDSGVVSLFNEHSGAWIDQFTIKASD